MGRLHAWPWATPQFRGTIDGPTFSFRLTFGDLRCAVAVVLIVLLLLMTPICDCNLTLLYLQLKQLMHDRFSIHRQTNVQSKHLFTEAARIIYRFHFFKGGKALFVVSSTKAHGG